MSTRSTTTSSTSGGQAVGQLLGYARVSTGEQDVALQLDALEQAGCVRIWAETASGRAGAVRPELAALLEYARPGDVLVVWRLDRLGRSLRELVALVDQLRERDIVLRSLTEAIDTTVGTAAGRLQLHLFAVLAEFERDVLLERTGAALAAARARGRLGGRPPVITPQKAAAARSMHADGASLAQIAAAIGVAKTTVRRHLATTAAEVPEESAHPPVLASRDLTPRVQVLGDLFHGRLPAGAVYVGRAAPGLPASRWANAHRVGGCRCSLEHDQAGVVQAYAEDLADSPALVAAARAELPGRPLACWCRPGALCHGDVLALVAAGADPAAAGDLVIAASSASQPA